MHFLISIGLAVLGLIAVVLFIAIVFLALRAILTAVATGIFATPGVIRNVPSSLRSVPWRSKDRFAWSDLLLIPSVLIGATIAGFIIGPVLAYFGVR